MPELIPLPPWIKWNKAKGHYVTLDPFECQNPNCKATWYPRINADGTIDIPETCPVCRTQAYRKKRS